MMYWLIGIIFFVALTFYLYFGHYAMSLFYQCMKHDVRISYWELAVMKKRGVPINDYLRTAIKLKEKGIDVKIKDLELHAKSGGRIANVVELLMKAKKNKVELTYHQAAIMDLEEVAKHRKNGDNNQTDKTSDENPETEQNQSDSNTQQEATAEAVTSNETETTTEEKK